MTLPIRLDPNWAQKNQKGADAASAVVHLVVGFGGESSFYPYMQSNFYTPDSDIAVAKENLGAPYIDIEGTRGDSTRAVPLPQVVRDPSLPSARWEAGQHAVYGRQIFVAVRKIEDTIAWTVASLCDDGLNSRAAEAREYFGQEAD